MNLSELLFFVRTPSPFSTRRPFVHFSLVLSVQLESSMFVVPQRAGSFNEIEAANLDKKLVDYLLVAVCQGPTLEPLSRDLLLLARCCYPLQHNPVLS